MKKEWVILALLVLLCLHLVNAETYYADVNIDITGNGLVSIIGETNHPELSIENSPELTSKEGRYWLFNVSVDDYFSNFIYKLNLPNNAVINYMKLPEFARIENSDKGLSIIGTGENKQFEIIIQYSFNNVVQRNYLLTSLGFIFALVILGFVLYFYMKTKKLPKCIANTKFLTERQKLIFDIVKKNKKPITQAQIEKITKLPKSSLSRNIDSLVRKGILQKEQIGMSNMIFIKKQDVPPNSGEFRGK